MITFVQEQMGGRSALPHHGTKFLLGNAILCLSAFGSTPLVAFPRWKFSCNAGGISTPVGTSCGRVATAVPYFQRQRKLLVAALVILVGANDALHQVMPHHVALIEVAEANAFHVP